MNQQPECLKSFKEIQLPISSKDFFFFAIPDSVKAPYGEAFDEQLFSTHLYKPLPAQNPFNNRNCEVYPFGYTKKDPWFIAFVIYTVKEPGYIEPQVKAYILDELCNKKDSLTIHNRYVWDGSERTNFEMSSRGLISITTETNVLEDENKIISKVGTKHYIINIREGKFVLQ